MGSLDDLLATAAAASSPMLVEKGKVQVGGVDPLGLRQINFDLMDKVLPGLNNVANRLRPFVLMTWAWRRARVIIERDNLEGATDEELRDFVDRTEAIYAWSQFLIDSQAEIPGGQALYDLLYGPGDIYIFGGDAWEERKKLRRTSTGLISPLNYGPGLRSMGWLIPAGPPGVYQPNPALDSMLDSFEANFVNELEHPVFNVLGAVEVHRDDVRRWGTLWTLSDLTDVERQAGYDRLAGPQADDCRRETISMLQAALASLNGQDRDSASLRALMVEPPQNWLADTDLHPRAAAWRRLQIRQLFRLSLEGLFYWILKKLVDGPISTDSLAQRFLDDAVLRSDQLASQWLDAVVKQNAVHQLDQLANRLETLEWQSVPAQIAFGLQICLTCAGDEQWESKEAFDRLPLTRALKEIEQWRKLSMRQFIGKIIEVWVIAQHTYWCVGRGLADARGRGKTLLRLRIVIDDVGWTLTPGAIVGGFPLPTPDRLQSAIDLLEDCGRFENRSAN